MYSPLAQEAFGRLKGLLAEFSDRVTVTESERGLLIEPTGPDTFPIQVEDDGRELTIFACGWHTHEETADSAVHCTMWLLTPFYRIVETEKNGETISAQLETYGFDGQWSVFEKTSLFSSLLGFKRNRMRFAYQQDVVPTPEGFLEEFLPGTLDAGNFPLGCKLGKHILEG